MTRLSTTGLSLVITLAGLITPGWGLLGLGQAAEPRASSCPAPVLSRLIRHRVARGETLATIAEAYNLMAGTIIGLNPSLQSAGIRVGQELVIPPYNGIQVRVNAGQTWAQVAEVYSTRADLLFEANGCISTVPAIIFVPGVNWFPGIAANPSLSPRRSLGGYPLPTPAPLLRPYGWQPDATQNKVVFNTGVALASPAGTAVLAVADGTVAFAGTDPVYGPLVVVNHAQGLQSRYASIANLRVKSGQRLRQGDRLALVAPSSSDQPTFLYFEVRLNSAMGWVAQDPADFVAGMAEP
ncbi:MAG: peptidoglycan DD-metalloendopeptidase family protein [Nodosilinea sp.]|jgi:murein DD-endopeptidase MepM/ murein hydrolase activator NlpD